MLGIVCLGQRKDKLENMVNLTALLLVVVFAAALSRTDADADTNEKINEGFAEVVGVCLKENGIKEDIKMAQLTTEVEKLNPCVFDCLFKKTGAINSKGAYDELAFITYSKTVLNKPGDAEKIEKVAKACASAHDKTYDKCQDSMQLVHCIYDERKKVGL